jgi:hypothetical protein
MTLKVLDGRILPLGTRSLATNARSEKMWKVGDVEPVRVVGAEGYPYGFNVSTEDGKPVVSFAYASRALAEAAATHLESAVLNAISVHPYAG